MLSRHDALKLLETFIYRELRARKSSNCFYIINGDNICAKCRSSKRRTLYMIISEEMPVMLKCFRASCTSDYVINNPGTDVNKARPITKNELIQFGFTNIEAIDVILDTSNLVFKKTRSSFDANVLVNNNLLTINQKKYLAERCKFYPSEEDMSLYHIVSDVNNVISVNDIPLPDTLESIYKTFSVHNSLSFLCSDLTLSTRALDSTPAIQKSIINIADNVKSIGYRIGNEVTNKSTLVISEGIYDLINIHRVFASGIKDALYVATLGFGKTQSIIEHYYYQNIEKMGKLIIFMDSDVKRILNGMVTYTYNEKQLYNLIRNIDLTMGPEAFVEVFVCYNTKGKDCGDFRDPINMKKVKVNRKELFKPYINKNDYYKR